MKYIIDIQDLWPEAFCMAVKNKIFHYFFYPMKKYIDYAYSKADCVVAVSETYVNRALAVNKKIDRGFCCYLGNNCHLFDEGKNEYMIERNDNEIWIGYIGSMGDSYDIESVIDAISVVQEEKRVSKKIRFVLCGDGEKRHYFEETAKKKNVRADFLGMKKYKEMAGILSSCDIAVNPIVKGSAASVINKVGDYAFSGLPVINTQECQEYRNLVEKYQCGINCNCEDVYDIAKALEILISDDNLRKVMGNNSRKLGMECFDRRNTYQNLAGIVEEKLEKKGKILIVANFSGNLMNHVNGRFTYLAEMLSEKGFDVELITSDFQHTNKIHGKPVSESYKSKITLIHEPGYKKNISVKRLYSHWIWGHNVLEYIKSLEEEISCIYCAVPSLTVNVNVAKYCKSKL